MYYSRILIVTVVLICNVFAAFCREDTRTQIFNPNFKTLQVQVEGNPLFPSVITLSGDDRILISFDELAEDMQYLRYSVVHCNADWQPSSLVESEYIDGFNYANIEDYGFSSGTFAHYVHYRISLPNENMQLLKSGNYLLKVYPENEPDDILLQARFSVTEQAVNVESTVTSRTDIDYNSVSQQISVKVDTRNYEVRDTYNDLRVVVSQNSRIDNEVVITSPQQAGRNYAYYAHNRNLIFPAGNEFRRFEVVATNYPGMNVEGIEYYPPYYHAMLFTDKSRSELPYLYDQTQRGRYTVRQSSANNSDTQADYVVVHFSLDIPQKFGGKIYVTGNFTNNIFDNSNNMRYNPVTGKYEVDMLLKMGSYNYQYLWVPDDSTVGFTAPIEGNHYQTVNEYLVKIYHRPVGERYDRLVGFSIAFSGK